MSYSIKAGTLLVQVCRTVEKYRGKDTEFISDKKEIYTKKEEMIYQSMALSTPYTAARLALVVGGPDLPTTTEERVRGPRTVNLDVYQRGLFLVPSPCNGLRNV